MSTGNEGMLFKQEMITVGPKTKRCKPRRRGGMSGYLLGAAPGPYFQCTSEPSSPAPSSSLKPNGSPSQPHDIPEHEVEPFVTPLSRDSPLTELEDNLQSEMIELDTITGSREPSPSPCDPQGHHDSVLLSTHVETDFALEDNTQMLTNSVDTAEPIITRNEDNIETDLPLIKPDGDTPLQPEYIDPAKVNGITPKHEVLSNEVVAEINGCETLSIHETPVSEAKNPTPPDLANPGEKDEKPSIPMSDQTSSMYLVSDVTETQSNAPPNTNVSPGERDSKPNIQLDNVNVPEPPSAENHQELSVGLVSDEAAIHVDVPETDGGKRKEREIEKVCSGDLVNTSDSVVTPDPVIGDAYGKPSTVPCVEGESQVAKSVKDDIQRKYKRQRRTTVPKH